MPTISRPVLMCGENPIATLYEPGGNRAVAVASYWRCTMSAHGAGHALVLWVAASAAPGGAELRAVFTDNPPLALLLRDTLTRHFPEFDGLPVGEFPLFDASCGHSSDGLTSYTASARGAASTVTVAWGELLDRKQLVWPGFPAGQAAFDLTTVICPCGEAQITVNGRPIAGVVRRGGEAGAPSSSAFLAFAETWVGPV
jgi:hypothetical protein